MFVFAAKDLPEGGRKERLVPLTPRLLAILREYWSVELPPKPWLFVSNCGNHMNVSTARQALHRARKRAGINKHITPHALRHSFATYLLDAGTDMRVIQVLLGHASIASTARYVQVSRKLIAKVKSPLDQISATG